MLNVTVPGNTTAEIYLPKPEDAGYKWAIEEQEDVCWWNGSFVAGVPGIIGAKEDGDFIVLHVGCGDYRFEAGIFR